MRIVFQGVFSANLIVRTDERRSVCANDHCELVDVLSVSICILLQMVTNRVCIGYLPMLFRLANLVLFSTVTCGRESPKVFLVPGRYCLVRSPLFHALVDVDNVLTCTCKVRCEFFPSIGRHRFPFYYFCSSSVSASLLFFPIQTWQDSCPSG